MTPNDFAIIGVPIDSVGRSGGAELSPAVLRELGLVAAIAATDRGDLDVRVKGDERDPETGILASADVLATTATIRTAVAELVAAGERPLLAGGCCAELPGALAGARDALGAIGLIHLDGHQDLYDGTTSPTGEAADMPISVALGLGPSAWVEAVGGAAVEPRCTALLGYRDDEESIEHGMAQPEEVSPDIHRLPIDAIRADGPHQTVESAIAAVTSGGAPFWLHLDVDVLDQDVFPATDYLMPNGMDWDELRGVLAPLLSSSALIGASLACYNPEKDPDHACGRALVKALASARAQ